MSITRPTTDQEDMQRAIGLVTIAGGHIEASMRYLLIRLMGHPGSLAPELLTAGQAFKWLHDTCRAIVRELPAYGQDVLTAEQLAEFNALMVDVNAAWQHRNFIVHGVWEFHDVTAAARHKYGRLQPEIRDMGTSDINGVARRLLDVAGRIMRLGDELGLT